MMSVLVDLFSMTISLLAFGFFFQCFEGFCTGRNTIIEENFESIISHCNLPRGSRHSPPGMTIHIKFMKK